MKILFHRDYYLIALFVYKIHLLTSCSVLLTLKIKQPAIFISKSEFIWEKQKITIQNKRAIAKTISTSSKTKEKNSVEKLLKEGDLNKSLPRKDKSSEW